MQMQMKRRRSSSLHALPYWQSLAMLQQQTVQLLKGATTSLVKMRDALAMVAMQPGVTHADQSVGQLVMTRAFLSACVRSRYLRMHHKSTSSRCCM